MRLPIVTKEHQIHEDARQHNEALYAAFLEDGRLAVPTTVETIKQTQNRESSDYRRFWLSRGFKIKTKRSADHTVLWVWLARVPVTQAAA